MKELFDIRDKVIVVTGAAGVLAGGTAEYLLKQGAVVVFLDLNRQRLDEALEKAKEISGKVFGYVCNVLDQDQVKAVYEKIMAEFGRVDVLINGAGGNMPGATIAPDQDVCDLNMADYDKVLSLNLKGTVLPTTVFSQAFAKQKKGCIVNFSSMTASLAITRVLGYSNAKSAVENFTRWMASELALKHGDGIRVNAIAPGFFIGNQNRKLLVNEDGSYTERGSKVIENTPFRRFGRAEEVFGTIHYLISDAASFVTGTVVPVDGGFSIFSGV